MFGALHRKKFFREFPVPSRDVTTKLSLGGNYDVITEFLPRGSLVSDIPAGDGKPVNLFLRYSSLIPPVWDYKVPPPTTEFVRIFRAQFMGNLAV
jgi:hypothetical protein